MNLTRKVKSCLTSLGILSLLALLYGCDTLEQDVKPDDPIVEITNNEVYAISNRSAYIDLFSKVKTIGTVRLDITSQPTKGNLSEVGTGLLKYTPDDTFKSGRDFFTFSIIGQQDQLLLSDSIIIIIGDSTDIPCGMYPQDDWAYASGGSAIDINVLLNDYICGDTTDVVLEFYRPNSSFLPHHGSVTLIPDGRIRYVANDVNTFTSDSIVYKISRASDGNVFGFGTVHIDISPADSACHPEAGNLEATHQSAYPISDTLLVLVLGAGNYCGVPYNNLSVVSPPKMGEASVEGQYIKYAFELTDSVHAITDTLRFEVCDGMNCLEGNLKIMINN